MSGNSIGKLFCVTTFGESHGIALGGIIDGMPPNFPLNENDIQIELDKRKPGTSIYTTPRRENDKIKILSGIFNGVTTGTSIGYIIENNDQRSQDYDNIKNIFRPGHADFTYYKKYGIRDYRGGGRSSARETCIRVAAGAIANKFLNSEFNINIISFVSQIGNIKCENKNINFEFIDKNPFFFADETKINDIDLLIRDIKKKGDSIGAKITIIVKNIPIGLGDPVFDKLDASLAFALMGINAVKGVEIGDGFSVIDKLGSENRDEMINNNFTSNHAGGILGGISTGQDILINIAIKPTSSISKECNTIDIYGNNTKLIIKGRHDPCVGIRAVPIAKSMVSIIIMDHLLRYYSQCKIYKNK